MIEKASSIDLNNFAKEATNKMNAMHDMAIKKIKQAEKYRRIGNAIQEAMSYNLNSASLGNYNKSMVLDDAVDGTYDTYGNYIHPVSATGQPRNLLNVLSNGRKEVIFRDNVICTLNGVTNRDVQAALYHEDHAEKDYYFDFFDEDTVELKVKVNDENYVALMDIDMIEIAPTIGSTFRLEKMVLKDYYTNEVVEIDSALINAGPTRYLLDKKVSLSEVTFTFKLHYKDSNGKYPFGLNHIYFLDFNADTRSNAVIAFKHTDFIDSISEKVYLQTPTEVVETTLTDIGAKLYLNYSNGIFDYEIETSINDDRHYLSVNTRTIYISLPIKNAYASLQFDEILTK